jgi:hypothetical protein
MKASNAVSALTRRALTGLMIAVTATLAASSVACAPSAGPANQPIASPTAVAAHVSSPGHTVHFPSTLFGQHRNTSAAARNAAHSIARTLVSMGLFTHPQAAVYGSSPISGLFIVGVAELSASARKYGGKSSAASLRRGLLIQGSPDARAFPAGAPGAVLACGDLTRASITEVVCIRRDKQVIGMAVYFNGTASSLSDAAANTNRAISAIGG